MIVSMTAFARTEKEESGYRITIEIKTLNGRYLDIVLRFPKNLPEIEEPARKRIAQLLRRGRVEVLAQVEAPQLQSNAPRIDPLLAKSYWKQLQDIHALLPGTDPPEIQNLLNIPYIFEAKETVADRDVLSPLLLEALADALEKIQAMRAREGETLLRDIAGRLELLREEAAFIAGRKEVVLAEYQARLREKIQELMGAQAGEPDPNRLFQEVAIMAERSDITEEIVRLQSHFEQIGKLLAGDRPADGRTLDFITQELHREVNTIGSKSGDLEIIQSIVRMKSEIGKLKEQVQNIE